MSTEVDDEEVSSNHTHVLESGHEILQLCQGENWLKLGVEARGLNLLADTQEEEDDDTCTIKPTPSIIALQEVGQVDYPSDSCFICIDIDGGNITVKDWRSLMDVEDGPFAVCLQKIRDDVAGNEVKYENLEELTRRQMRTLASGDRLVTVAKVANTNDSSNDANTEQGYGKLGLVLTYRRYSGSNNNYNTQVSQLTMSSAAQHLRTLPSTGVEFNYEDSQLTLTDKSNTQQQLLLQNNADGIDSDDETCMDYEEEDDPTQKYPTQKYPILDSPLGTQSPRRDRAQTTTTDSVNSERQSDDDLYSGDRANIDIPTLGKTDSVEEGESTSFLGTQPPTKPKTAHDRFEVTPSISPKSSGGKINSTKGLESKTEHKQTDGEEISDEEELCGPQNQEIKDKTSTSSDIAGNLVASISEQKEQELDSEMHPVEKGNEIAAEEEKTIAENTIKATHETNIMLKREATKTETSKSSIDVETQSIKHIDMSQKLIRENDCSKVEAEKNEGTTKEQTLKTNTDGGSNPECLSACQSNESVKQNIPLNEATNTSAEIKDPKTPVDDHKGQSCKDNDLLHKESKKPEEFSDNTATSRICESSRTDDKGCESELSDPSDKDIDDEVEQVNDSINISALDEPTQPLSGHLIGDSPVKKSKSMESTNHLTNNEKAMVEQSSKDKKKSYKSFSPRISRLVSNERSEQSSKNDPEAENNEYPLEADDNSECTVLTEIEELPKHANGLRALLLSSTGGNSDADKKEDDELIEDPEPEKSPLRKGASPFSPAVLPARHRRDLTGETKTFESSNAKNEKKNDEVITCRSTPGVKAAETHNKSKTRESEPNVTNDESGWHQENTVVSDKTPSYDEKQKTKPAKAMNSRTQKRASYNIQNAEAPDSIAKRKRQRRQEQNLRILVTGIELTANYRSVSYVLKQPAIACCVMCSDKFFWARYMKQKICALGGELLETIEEAETATHVICSDGKEQMRRTPKLLIGICNTSNLLTSKWLVDSALKRAALPVQNYLVLNDKAFEKKHKFKMRTALANSDRFRQNNTTLLAGRDVFICKGVPGNKAPPENELKLIVHAAGGNWLSRSPRGKCIIITSDPPAKNQLRVVRQGSQHFTISWLFNCILSQELQGLNT